MTITQAAAAIAAAVQAGQIDHATACRAQDAIRGRGYGMRLSNRDRASIVRNRFGIEVAS